MTFPKIWMQKQRVDKNKDNAIWFDKTLNLYFVGPKKYIGKPLEEIEPPFLRTSGTMTCPHEAKSWTITCPHEAKSWSYFDGTEWVESNCIGMYIIGLPHLLH